LKTYGQLLHRKGSWIIETEPHVIIRLRRVFQRISKPKPIEGETKQMICLTDTLETSRELEWFLTRFPLKPENGATELRLAERAAKHRDAEHQVQELLSREPGKKPVKAPEFRTAIPVRDYQKEGAQLGLLTGGTLLAWDMGLGKSACSIYMLLDPRTRPALIVTLTALPDQWESEVRKFAPKLTTHVIRSTRPYDIAKACGGKFPDVLIISYSKIAGWKDDLIVNSFIVDEIQEFRSGADTKKGAAGQAIAKRAKFVLGLSGTPFANMGGEAYHIFEIIRSGYLGTYREFTTEWCVGDSENAGRVKLKDPVAFGSYLRHAGLMDRKTKADVGRELPKLNKIIQIVDHDHDHLRSIQDRARALAETILSKTERTRGAKMQASEEFSNILRRVTGEAKAPWVADLVRLLVESGESVLCYLWHRSVYAIILERLKDLNPCMFTGSESPAQKAESKRKFCAGETKVLLMSLRAGTGLDGLQHNCSTVVHGELDWTPMAHDQGTTRIYRDGQTKPVFAYFPLADDGSDPVVSDVLGVKRSQLEGVRDLSVGMDALPPVDMNHVKLLAETYLSRTRKSA